MKIDSNFEQVAEAAKFTIRPMSGRVLKLLVKDAHHAQYIDERKIEYIDIDGLIFKKDDIITVGKGKYKIMHIANDGVYGDGYTFYTHILTKISFHFIMPSLGTFATDFRLGAEFCNCFIGMEGNELFGDSIYLLYRFNGNKVFMEFEKALMRHTMYKANYNVDNFHILYEFNIPDKHKEDIEKILDGKYSYVSPKYKEKVVKFHGGENNPLVKDLMEILTRSPRRKKVLEDKYDIEIPDGLDLLEKPSWEEEIYLDKYRIPKEESKESKFEISEV